MTYGYMRTYEDCVRRAGNTPDALRPVRALAGRHGAEHPRPSRNRAWPPAMARAVARSASASTA